MTDVLKELLADATGVAACGPKPMLKAIAALAKDAGLPCQVSMEERMGCGIGACLVCACALKADNGEKMCIRDRSWSGLWYRWISGGAPAWESYPSR